MQLIICAIGGGPDLQGVTKFPRVCVLFSLDIFLTIANELAEDEYPGLQFVKGDVLDAFSLKHTQANSDAALFSADIAKVQKWVDNPHGNEFEHFRKMKIGDFKRYCQEKKAKKASGKRKKQHRSSSGSSDETPQLKAVKGKGKAKEMKTRQVIDSDDMDDTD
jgi:hypothetical protein